ncbi:MAG: hypothetical protein J6T60_03025 [Bacteroidales bacterium]|nr:hypothetical protein [Bacteroidales bacterium]
MTKLNSEFTPEMHLEMLGDECSFLEMMIMKASVYMRRGMPKDEALAKCHITESQFNDNYSKVFPGSTLETLEKFIEIEREEREKAKKL